MYQLGAMILSISILGVYAIFLDIVNTFYRLLFYFASQPVILCRALDSSPRQFLHRPGQAVLLQAFVQAIAVADRIGWWQGRRGCPFQASSPWHSWNFLWIRWWINRVRAASNFTPNFLVLQTDAACLMGERASETPSVPRVIPALPHRGREPFGVLHTYRALRCM